MCGEDSGDLLTMQVEESGDLGMRGEWPLLSSALLCLSHGVMAGDRAQLGSYSFSGNWENEGIRGACPM